MYRIESFLSTRLFVSPQLVGRQLYFISNISGRLSLYSMKYGGSVPEPLLPPHIALQNPPLLGGYSFHGFPRLGTILVMIDRDGDENYQPMLIPMDGGFPEPAFDNFFVNHRVHLVDYDDKENIVYFNAERRDKSLYEIYQGSLSTGRLTKIYQTEFGLYATEFGNWTGSRSEDNRRVLISEGYAVGDNVLFLFENGKKKAVFGKPLEERAEGENFPLNGLTASAQTSSGRGILLVNAVLDDQYSLGYLELSRPSELKPVELKGVVHTGHGEMTVLEHLTGSRYLVGFNIDGCSWLYEGYLDEDKRCMNLKFALVGPKPLYGGVLQHHHYDQEENQYVISFSTATSPSQIYTIEGRKRDRLTVHTNEKILGIPQEVLSKGEDASYISFDGLRVSARLYLPAESLGFKGQRPLVYYVHGGPQSQERPDFTWFSMPLIQFLTLRGFAVFVPNVRGSSGYGLEYMKHVDCDWGGKDRLDHVHAMREVLPQDTRLDVSRTGLVGRSYGGYMTLTLAGRHPNLWSAACDMFGPYDLLTFSERIPATWKPHFRMTIGDPDKPEGSEFLVERSPRSYLENLACPMLVIQGRNDPRVVAAESEDLVDELRQKGKDIELLIFEDEGHDVLKYENRVRCYSAITNFFAEHLKLKSF
ncbi:MAG TPA: prolyl oligopeptidase family serine peptidase [Anaerolineales bacterium]|nr:prolyl oligopeptidase family serine peptidase [Anaerolineales bacterium]